MRTSLISAMTAVAVMLVVPISAAVAQDSEHDRCMQQAEEVYLQEMRRCQTYPFHDYAERDYCEYGAGLTYDGNRQSCNSSYPPEMSALNQLWKRSQPASTQPIALVA